MPTKADKNLYTVVHLSTAHPWHDGRVFARECRTLASLGYHVVLIAVSDQPRHADGVRVLPAPKLPRWRRMLLGVPRALRLALRERAVVYHLHDPELAPIIPLLRLRGARVVYDAHEDLPTQILDKSYLPRSIRPALALAARGLCRFADRTADHVVTATPAIAKRFTPSRTTVLPNYPDLDDLANSTDPADKPVDAAVYLGAISAVRGIGQLVAAIALVPRTTLDRLLLIGPCSEPGLLARLRAAPGWERVDHPGPLERHEAWRAMASARLGVVLFQPTRAHTEALPNKLFEYMAAGIPVVASDFPAWRPLVAGTGCGLLVDPTDPRAIAEAIVDVASQPDRARAMGERGRAAVRERFNWASQRALLREVYAGLVPPPVTGSPPAAGSGHWPG